MVAPTTTEGDAAPDNPRLVSIVLPTFNGARYLDGALRSCLEQTYRRFEVVVVVDGSTDDTDQVLARHNDIRLKVIHHDRNRGLPQALNTGFAAAQGDYLTWTSDDNEYLPPAIETMVTFLEVNPEVDFVYCSYWTIDARGQIMRAVNARPIETMLEDNPVGACFLYTRRVYETIGEYDAKTMLFEDYDYWLRVWRRFRMQPLDEFLYRYRLHGRSLTGNRAMVYQRLRLANRLKRQRYGLPWRRYWLEMARIDVEEAFACYRDGAFGRVPPLTLRAVLRNPTWLRNIGLSSIAIRSLGHLIKGRGQ